MSKIRVFSDSTCDLPPELREQHQIGIIPLYVTFGEDAYKDGVEMTPLQLFHKVDELGYLPKTASPSPGDFIQAFAPAIEAGDDIIFIGLSTELSSTCQNAIIAADSFPEGRITVVDSRNLSTGIGLLVLKAVRAAEAGRTLQEIEQIVLDSRDRIETEFIIDTLDYLHKGGRCSSLQNFIGSLLKIRPVVKVVDGRMILAAKLRGKREKTLEQLIQNALHFKDQLEGETISVTHALAEEEAIQVREILLRETNAKEVLLAETGCVISSHCGPHTVGIVLSRNGS
ncbi:fatty acid-binding protein DegV [Paenibacillus selenitireducens]|uniref:Fatty acid-binding protein DegV n=1 Tax=Paenibacillus selenitireducens TaxID=1324314 RepID=A0A1T2XLR5_9BACL|nr:DegV family protein [Paenibacillus selenitireducens]OPA80807.1 fatty acid-binding protein DegV [Paenibacillus selenitireducens]